LLSLQPWASAHGPKTAQPPKKKAQRKKTDERPSDVQQCGEAADQGRQAAGPSEQRAAERSAAALLRRPLKKQRENGKK